jgi:hypothetical protein
LVGLIPSQSAASPLEAESTVLLPIAVAQDVGPIPELSTATSSTVREADGSYTLLAYTTPINFEDEDGGWVPIDNRLVPSEGSRYEVENAANSYLAKRFPPPARRLFGSRWTKIG